MARTDRRPKPPGPQPSRFFLPRSHRLFAVFEDMASVETALAALPDGEELRGRTWVFAGPDGARLLGPGEVAGAARLASWLFSHNIEHLRGLARLVEDGFVVVALPVRRVAVADSTARRLREHGAQWSAYTAHGNFVPVSL